jgi:hypothetical protein
MLSGSVVTMAQHVLRLWMEKAFRYVNRGVPHDTTGLRPLKKWSYHGERFSIDLYVMNGDTFQNK